MANPTPVPRPATLPASPSTPGSIGAPRGKRAPDPLDPYHRVADTVGMVPSLRVKDNVIQAVVVVAGLLIGAGIGGIVGVNQNVTWWYGVGAGAVGGVIIATFLSGLVLMVVGWFRGVKR
ncbi:MAG: hypothetical protein ACT4PL_04480 [Phycisphaerales bacterium]